MTGSPLTATQSTATQSRPSPPLGRRPPAGAWAAPPGCPGWAPRAACLRARARVGACVLGAWPCAVMLLIGWMDGWADGWPVEPWACLSVAGHRTRCEGRARVWAWRGHGPPPTTGPPSSEKAHPWYGHTMQVAGAGAAPLPPSLHSRSFSQPCRHAGAGCGGGGQGAAGIPVTHQAGGVGAVHAPAALLLAPPRLASTHPGKTPDAAQLL